MTTLAVNSALEDYFRPPAGMLNFRLDEPVGTEVAEFRFSPDIQCFGRLHEGREEREKGGAGGILSARLGESKVALPFDPGEVADNLRLERYPAAHTERRLMGPAVRAAYYALRPCLPVPVRRHLQRRALRGWKNRQFPSWPVDRTVDRLFAELMRLLLIARGGEKIPFIWFWPDGKSGCVLMTHDVEGPAGLRFCKKLMDLNDSFGIKSSFQIIPGGRYTVSPHLREEIQSRGFELNVHDWNHDGTLFQERKAFLASVSKINETAAQWGALGFRSAVLYRRPDWFDSLAFEYDMSVPNVAHLDPQPGGCCTIMPYFIGRLLEIPVTTTQDYSLFHIFRTDSIELWTHQTAAILEGNGLASFIVHPDYVIEARAAATYSRLLEHICNLHMEQDTWVTLPRSVNQWWRQRSQMKLVRSSNGWQVTGPGSERARVAYAHLDNDRLVYTLEEPASTQHEDNVCAVSAES